MLPRRPVARRTVPRRFALLAVLVLATAGCLGRGGSAPEAADWQMAEPGDAAPQAPAGDDATASTPADPADDAEPAGSDGASGDVDGVLDSADRAQLEAYLAEAHRILEEGAPGLSLDLPMWADSDGDCPPGFVPTLDHYFEQHRELLEHLEMLESGAPPGVDAGLGPLQRELEAQLELYAEIDQATICAPAEPGDAPYLDEEALRAHLREMMLHIEDLGLEDPWRVRSPQSSTPRG